MMIVFRIFAWLLGAAVALATLGPVRYRPLNYNLGQDGEHALAFVLFGLVFGLGYSRNRLLTAATAVGLIGLIEVMQLWVPGRHARLEDFAVDALAAIAGLAVAAALDWTIKRVRMLNSSAS
jgi:VanZ family protein